MNRSNSQRRPTAWLFALAVQAILVQIVWIGARLMLSYQALAEGADTGFIAFMAMMLSLPALLIAFPLGRAGDRFGGAAVTLLGLSALLAGAVLFAFETGLPFLLTVSTLLGIGNVATGVGQQTLVAHLSAEKQTEASFGVLMTAVSIGQLIGAPLVTFIASASHIEASTAPDAVLAMMSMAACVALAIPPCIATLVIARRRPDSGERRSRTGRPLAVLRIPGLPGAVVVSSVILVTVDFVYSFLPVWAAERGVSATAVGWLLALRALVSVLSRIGLGRLVRRFGRRSLLITAISIGAMSLAALPFADGYGAVLPMIGLGICLGLPQPLTLAWVVRITPPNLHGSALGLRMAGNRLAQVVVPAAVGTFAAPLGAAAVFWICTALLMSSVVVVTRADLDGNSSEAS